MLPVKLFSNALVMTALMGGGKDCLQVKDGQTCRHDAGINEGKVGEMQTCHIDFSFFNFPKHCPKGP